MNNNMQKSNTISWSWVSVLVVILVSTNLRSPITAVGPVLGQISDYLTLDSFQSSLLTAIPLFMFASCSVLVSKYSHVQGMHRFLLFGLIVLAVGIIVRVGGGTASLFAGSVMIGLGICVGNVVAPGYIKTSFPKHIGLMTGIFAVAMNLTAAFASGFSLRLGEWTGFGWRGSLGVWVILAVLSIIAVFFDRLGGQNNVIPEQKKQAQTGIGHIFKSRLAWYISIFMGIQSLVYYSLISWLPKVLVDYGMAAKDTGWLLFLIQIAMIPIMFVGPIIAHRMKDQRLMAVAVAVGMLGSILIFFLYKLDGIYVAAILLGLSNGLSFSLSILFFSLRAKSTANAIKISGMAQSVGYLIAAFGPPIFGKLHEIDPSWDYSFYFLAISIVLLLLTGIKAAENKFVEES
ncbi:transporter [Sphingobacterium sp. CZ-UAM]|jgi:CP family cyanate transporter-like MFS transporter|uniref:CynX/NimT family MFS transporter n=1 Tax=unclassified Sphingobacterium TaxID=2609468 RepID=UPI000984E61F|nr:MFS transporter [Sphingobacterium sp. CZ-UAM]OOG18621.1 transporter [Sphingobacterium sp. CZ-UAM]